VFQNFRPKLKRMPPPAPSTREEIEQLFKDGELRKATKLCTRSGLALSDFRGSIEAGARVLWRTHQPIKVLCFLYDTGMPVGIETITLLKGVFESRDWHGFLKQAHRLGIWRGLEVEIDIAIQRLLEKNQTHDAEGWRRKFHALRHELR
jgi:hypothetical protein